uniref:Uncharacterized protein n=1 Tax=Octopus bimaculoides TaxID=37653 RepID=A0A0L8GW33_OCTBM
MFVLLWIDIQYSLFSCFASLFRIFVFSCRWPLNRMSFASYSSTSTTLSCHVFTALDLHYNSYVSQESISV